MERELVVEQRIWTGIGFLCAGILLGPLTGRLDNAAVYVLSAVVFISGLVLLLLGIDEHRQKRP